MQVLIGNNKYINLDNYKPIVKGEDGTLYKCDNSIIKICHSGQMTYGKFKDLRRIARRCRKSGIDISKSHIILPSEIVDDPEKRVQHLAVSPLFGYTQQYKAERRNGMRSLRTSDFIDSIEVVHGEIHALFTRNSIAMSDSNPKNFLVSDTGEIFLIDHDRNNTPSSMISESGITYVEDFFGQNEKCFAQMVSKALILETFRGVEMNDSNMRKLMTAMYEETCSIAPVGTIYDALSRYDTISNYADDKAEQLKLKKS